MSSVNKVILLGNLGRDPEFSQTQAGGRFARLSIATSEKWRDRQSGERREKTEWHRVVIFNDHFVDVAERFLRKGSKVYLEGQLQTRKWQDQAGQDRYATEIVLGPFRAELVLLDKRESGAGYDDAGGGTARAAAAQSQAPTSGHGDGGGQRPLVDLDDDIPF